MPKTKCNCAAYRDEHNLDDPKCRSLYNHEDLTDDPNDDLLRDFEREEAQAYNRELSIFTQVRF